MYGKPQKVKRAKLGIWDVSPTKGNQEALAQEWLRPQEMPTWLLGR